MKLPTAVILDEKCLGYQRSCLLKAREGTTTLDKGRKVIRRPTV